LTGRETAEADAEIVLPLNLHQPFSFAGLKRCFRELPDPQGGTAQPASVCVGILDADSTNVYYRLHNGIRPPPEKVFLLAGNNDEDD
jgi:hypothetical protein